MKDNWNMATERNVSSVLAKLMGIDKPSISSTSRRRHRVLSENYLQNVASIAKRGKASSKASSYLDSVECDMDVTEDSADFSQGVNVIEHEEFRKSEHTFSARRSVMSSNSLSCDRKQWFSVSQRRNKGVQCQEKISLNNSIKSPIRGSLSSNDIAKQISGQVMHSAWHSCAELIKSMPGTEESCEVEEKERLTSSAIKVDLEKRLEASAYSSAKGSNSTSRETSKANKQVSEKWRTKKWSQYEQLVNHGDGNCCTASLTSNVNAWPVRGARYLSKSELFPSAWVPRSRARQFTLDKNWCLKPGIRDSKQCSDWEQGKVGHQDVQPTSLSSIQSLDLEKPGIHQEVSLILNDLAKFVEQKSSEEASSSTESSSNSSAFSSVESPTQHKVRKMINENGCGHLDNDVSQDSIVKSSCMNCNSAPISLEAEEVNDEGITKKNMSTLLWSENLSANPTACILLGGRESWIHQSKIKSNGSEPGSPVSSLEGPEAFRQVISFIVEAEECLPVSDSLENDAHGFQRKLQLIETISLESGSEGFGMVVSSEEGDDGRSIGCYQKDPQIMELDQTLIKESCDFSYIVDIVVESGLQIRNLEMESKMWWLRGYALDPLVFNLLEKKYGEHLPWEKSERRLLFDRINSFLLEKVKPWVGLNTWKKPVAKRLFSRQKVQEFIEDELWWLLVNQEEEVKQESSDKVGSMEMEWLDLDEDTDLIVQDIQSLLIDDLIEEFVCSETLVEACSCR